MKQLLPFVLTLCVACDKPAPTEPPKTTAPPPVEVAGDLGAVTPRADIQAHMREHWGLATVIRDATIAGTLDELPDVAGELADHKAPDALAKHAANIAQMRKAAERAQHAGDLVEAARATADLARACGDCHTALRANPNLPDEPLPPGEDATKAHMLRHDWAARELWAGLIIPSDERWAKGAAALDEKPLKQGEFFEDWEVTDQLIALDEAVHGMSQQIAGAVTRDQRVALYGDLIANCATCHSATAKGPVD